MNNVLPLLSFSILSLILYLINFPFRSSLVSSLFILFWISNGIYVTYLFYKNKNILLSIFLLLNIVVQVYFLFNFFYFDEIYPYGPFDFSAYKLQYIQEATNVLFVAFAVMLFSWSFYSKVILKTQKKDKVKLKIDQILLPIRKIKNRKIITVLFFVSSIALILFFTTATIYQAPYPYNKRLGFINFPDSLRPFLVLPYLFAYFVMKIKNNFRNAVSVIGYKILFFFALYFILLLIGPRGAATGLIILLMFFDLLTDNRWYAKVINLFIALIFVYFTIFLWPSMRFDIYSMGFLDALTHAWTRVTSINTNFFSTQFSLIPMIPQTLFHFLYVVALLDHGVNLQYQTFINLIPQQMPAFLESIFGERPLNDNYLLMKYFFHGGGFYIFANAYWNGGLTPLILFTGIVSWLLVKIEIFFKNVKDPLYFLAYPIFIILLPVNTLYGIQPFVRGLEFGAVTLLLIYMYRRFRRKRR